MSSSLVHLDEGEKEVTSPMSHRSEQIRPETIRDPSGVNRQTYEISSLTEARFGLEE